MLPESVTSARAANFNGWPTAIYVYEVAASHLVERLGESWFVSWFVKLDHHITPRGSVVCCPPELRDRQGRL